MSSRCFTKAITCAQLVLTRAESLVIFATPSRALMEGFTAVREPATFLGMSHISGMLATTLSLAPFSVSYAGDCVTRRTISTDWMRTRFICAARSTPAQVFAMMPAFVRLKHDHLPSRISLRGDTRTFNILDIPRLTFDCLALFLSRLGSFTMKVLTSIALMTSLSITATRGVRTANTSAHYHSVTRSSYMRQAMVR